MIEGFGREDTGLPVAYESPLAGNGLPVAFCLYINGATGGLSQIGLRLLRCSLQYPAFPMNPACISINLKMFCRAKRSFLYR